LVHALFLDRVPGSCALQMPSKSAAGAMPEGSVCRGRRFRSFRTRSTRSAFWHAARASTFVGAAWAISDFGLRPQGAEFRCFATPGLAGERSLPLGPDVEAQPGSRADFQVQPSGPKSIDVGPSSVVAGACAFVLAALVVLGVPTASKATEDMPKGWAPAKDLQVPILPEDELRRRHTAASKQVMEETWYKQGERTFRVQCAGCHTMNPATPEKQLITLDGLKEHGIEGDTAVQYVIRYGKKKMPGFAADCLDYGDYLQCMSTTPLKEDSLRNVQDYLLNRATAGWK